MLCGVTKMLVIISRAPEDGSINPFQKVVVYKYIHIRDELLSRHRAGPYNTHTPLHGNLRSIETKQTSLWRHAKSQLCRNKAVIPSSGLVLASIGCRFSSVVAKQQICNVIHKQCCIVSLESRSPWQRECGCHTKSHEQNGVVEGETRIAVREYRHVALVLLVLVLYCTEPGIKCRRHCSIDTQEVAATEEFCGAQFHKFWMNDVVRKGKAVEVR